MKKVFLFICMAALLLPLSAAAGTYTFTNDADWNAGTYTSTNSGPPGADHQVQLLAHRGLEFQGCRMIVYRHASALPSISVFRDEPKCRRRYNARTGTPSAR